MWIVCQIGAREHYAIPRALHGVGKLGALLTDLWAPPGHVFSLLPGARRFLDRYHPDLARARVIAPNAAMLCFELCQRLGKQRGWPVTMARNHLFQRRVVARLSRLAAGHEGPVTLFSYSYAARELFHFAKAKGWTTVLGQIDPGPEEERIVEEEHQRYPALGSRWQPAPLSYWNSWREEVDLADRIVVNSKWSCQCLLKEGVSNDKLEVIPLVYNSSDGGRPARRGGRMAISGDAPFRVLFLGQINLRKGVARLLEAMRLLRGDPVELILAGPSEIDPSIWSDLPNTRWIGPVVRSEVTHFYDEADVLILPTLSDGYALTQLEALSRGVPVIASRRCGNAVVPNVNGWLLDDLEPPAIAAAIRQAVRERLPGEIRAGDFGLRDLAEHLQQ